MVMALAMMRKNITEASFIFLEIDLWFMWNINTLYDKESENEILPNLEVSIQPLKKERKEKKMFLTKPRIKLFSPKSLIFHFFKVKNHFLMTVSTWCCWVHKCGHALSWPKELKGFWNPLGVEVWLRLQWSCNKPRNHLYTISRKLKD